MNQLNVSLPMFFKQYPNGGRSSFEKPWGDSPLSDSKTGTACENGKF